ncbi:MAG: thiol protease/hemagglutinin PrtT [Bacteroidales bacterium]|nr:thiol protease/hemagglutinin PrtT [Bacteroidales bacterium]
MKRITLIITLLAFVLRLTAGSVDVESAKQLGGKYMVANHQSASTALSLAYTETSENGINVCYVFNCQPKGFVIVAADDRMKPILGYSTESSFDQVASEAGPEVFFDAYRSDLETAIAMNLEQQPEIAAQWQRLAKDGTITDRGSRTVGPLCTSTWHQTQLYNDQCPVDLEGYNGHVKSGCVANAMAQIMRYWEWPKSGVGSHSYYCYGYGSTSYGTLTANFGEADYRYELMPDFLDYTSPQYQVDAVALLEYHAGVSVEMEYGPNASGAYSADAIDAFKTYFRYASSTTLADRDYYSDFQWIELMKNEIDNDRPMYYSAYSYTKDGNRGGHAFVCDGYDENDFFHFNWGWQGFDNGFYSVNAMNLTYHEYNYSHYTSTNLEPNVEYDNQPMPVSDVEAVPLFGGGIYYSATAPTHTIDGTALSSIDSVVLLQNGELLHTFVAPQPGEHLEFECYFYDKSHGCVDDFTAYPVTSGGRGQAVSEIVHYWTGSKPITFHLHDVTGDGWLSPAISVMVDQSVLYRIGLAEGSDGMVTVDVPFETNITLFWNYCNVGYEDDDEECSFEVYDYKGDLIYAQTEKPEVGVLYTFYNALDYLDVPDYITADYEYLEDGRFGVHVRWGMDNPNQWLMGFGVFRYAGDLNDVPDEFYVSDVDARDFFDEVAPGTYYYRIVAAYQAGGPGAPAFSDYAPNLDDPNLDYAMVTVTSTKEFFENEFTTVTVYNMMGQLVYSGQVSSMNPQAWKPGTYLLRYATSDGKQMTKKLVK